MRCIICHKEIADDAIGVPSMQGGKRVHRDCLVANLSRAVSDKKKRELVKGILEHETSTTKNNWTADDIGAQNAELTPLVKLGVLGMPLKTNKFKSYKLTSLELTREILQGEERPTETRQEGEIPQDIFDCIVGYDDLKENLMFVLEGRKKVNTLLVGPPATAKTLFINSIEKAIGGEAYLATGSRVTAAGLTEALMEYRPRVLLLDELDKLDMNAYAVLLSLMESGHVLETKHGKHGGIKLDTAVFGGCNRTNRMPPELLSRFEVKATLKEYGRSDFIAVCQSWLSREENIPEDLGKYIGSQVWRSFPDRDIRRARGVARLLKKNTKAEVDRVVNFMRKYES